MSFLRLVTNLRTILWVVHMTTGLMSVKNSIPQVMNMGLPQAASTGQCTGSRHVPLTSLISAFIFPPFPSSMEPDDCSKQYIAIQFHTLLHVQHPPGLAVAHITNNYINLTGHIWLKSTQWKNLSLLS